MSTYITCPNCHTQINIEQELSKELQQKIEQEQQQKIKSTNEQLAQAKKQLDDEKLQFEQKKANENKLFVEKLNAEIQKKTTQLQQEAKSQFEQTILQLKQQAALQQNALEEARKEQLAYLQKEKALLDREAALEITVEKKLLEERKILQQQISQREAEKNAVKEQELHLKILELQKQLEDTKQLADEQIRKIEQKSMQLQGEVLELEIEKILQTHFPFDAVEPVAKGSRGADSLLHVKNKMGVPVGKIIFESKNTEHFNTEWIEKLKADMRTAQADIAVLVTKAMPKDMNTFGEKSGIYITPFSQIKPLVQLLRTSLIKFNEVKQQNENKGEKMVALYDYLTGGEFVGNMNAMRENFKRLREMLVKERDAFEKNFKMKEKVIDQIIINSLQVSGSIEGIAGADIMINLIDEDTN